MVAKTNGGRMGHRLGQLIHLHVLVLPSLVVIRE
jgi:hypothetical protein